MTKDSKRNKQLLTYAAMAAILPASELNAQVVYHDIDPDLVVGTDTIWSGSESEYLDINDDGMDDFAITRYYDYGLSGYLAAEAIYIHPLSENRVAFELSNVPVENYAVGEYELFTENVALKFEFDDEIGSDIEFTSLNAYLVNRVAFDYPYESHDFNAWDVNQMRIAGLEINIDGDIHYGWVRMKRISEDWVYKVIVYDYAYEMTPSVPISASLLMPPLSDCVEVPTYSSSIVGPTFIKLFFLEDPDASQYSIRYRQAGTADSWTTKNKSIPNFKLIDLTCDTEYEFQVRSVCDVDGFISSLGWSELEYINSGSCRLASDNTEFKIYPNPVADQVSIKSNYLINELNIYHQDGRLIHSACNPGLNYNLDVSSWDSGLYLISITTASGIIWNKIVVE